MSPQITCVLLASSVGLLLLPIRRWQGLLMWLSAPAIRIAGIAAMVVGALLVFAPERLPEELRTRFEDMPSMTVFVLSTLFAVGCGLVAAFLDFGRQMHLASVRMHRLQSELQNAGALIEHSLNPHASPGVSLSEPRREELQSILRRIVNPNAPAASSHTIGEIMSH